MYNTTSLLFIFASLAYIQGVTKIKNSKPQMQFQVLDE
jgi:hypothetical protein